MKTILAVSIGLLAAMQIMAADQPGRVTDKPLTKEESRFRALDRDNDQKLSETELRADATSNFEFAKLDKDDDGFLSMAEFIARPIPPATLPPPVEER